MHAAHFWEQFDRHHGEDDTGGKVLDTAPNHWARRTQGRRHGANECSADGNGRYQKYLQDSGRHVQYSAVKRKVVTLPSHAGTRQPEVAPTTESV